MDIFRFLNPFNLEEFQYGEIINGITSKMWVERYRDAGEFKFVAPVSSGVKELLYIGAFVSHMNTTEIMVVENHEINDDAGKESEVTITGRTWETQFEQRIVGSNKTFPVSATLADFSISADYTWNQAVDLIKRHTDVTYLIDDNDSFPYTTTLTTVTSGTSVSIARTFKIDTLYKHVLDLLAIDNLGIKTVRPGLWSPISPTSPNVAVVIFEGQDRTNDVVFSWDTGEIVSADYLWSNKKFKNAAFVSGKWVQTVVEPTSDIWHSRRMMYVDASDIDKSYTTAPTGSTKTAIVTAMQQRGLEALNSQNFVVLAKADVAQDFTRAKYRVDFNIGDAISVAGDYNEAAPMRVSEFVETEDATGESGYPTLIPITGTIYPSSGGGGGGGAS